MSYNCVVLADSVGPAGTRLTTFEVTFPRMILAELNTHRALSRNSASSRAIPTEKLIAAVRTDPFVPEFAERVTGMGVGRLLTGLRKRDAEATWLRSARHACEGAEKLIDVDKSRANRLLEPFLWHTAIVSATDWQNFYSLRTAPTAQPEFQKIAQMMAFSASMSDPEYLEPGEWHLPLIRDIEKTSIIGIGLHNVPAVALVSSRRCARVSYNRQHDDEPVDASLQRCHDLIQGRHWSPLEHPAQALAAPDYEGNFCGFKQARKFFPEESGQYTPALYQDASA
jgi:hypothetical protein